MKLSELTAAEPVFIDANIFLYHFTGASRECKEFLQRCEAQELSGITGVTIMAEVCHRLMLAEAIKRGFISSSKPAMQLQKKPEIIKRLSEYPAQMTNIMGWGITILPAPENILAESQVFRTQFGLLTNDSCIPVYMKAAGASKIATNDRAFRSIPSLHVYTPSDI